MIFDLKDSHMKYCTALRTWHSIKNKGVREEEFMKYTYYVIVFCFFASHCLRISAYKAVIVVPVADLLGAPLSSQTVCASYQDIPVSPNLKKRHYAVCPRIHQALFNEVVEVLEEKIMK
jgi:hypothetical protein